MDIVVRAVRTDATQAAIVERLRSIGVWILDLRTQGKGVPDLLCWHRGRAFFIECKVPGEGLNKLQAEFFASCPIESHIARSADEAVAAAVGEALK